METTRDISRHIRNAKAAIAGYRDQRTIINNYNIADCLADLRHLCDKLGFDYGEIDGAAYRHYAAEISEARHALKQA